MNKKCVRIMKNLVPIGFASASNLDKAILACANIASSTEDVFTLDLLNCDLNVECSFEWSIPYGIREVLPEKELTEEE